MRYLLVEDAADLASSVMDLLRMGGHGVDWSPSLAEARDCLASARYDLILLDIALPDGDGRRFLTDLRAQGTTTPVIMMTARSAVSDRIGALDGGADDYVTKPFDLAELEARARAVLRLFEVLIGAPNCIFSKDQLCDRLFSFAESVTDNAIEVYVARLRRKLEGSAVRIETVRGLGYRLAMP